MTLRKMAMLAQTVVCVPLHMSCKWNAGQYCNIKMGSKFFENMAEFKYLEMTYIKIA
jgi:hypothetical protein